MVYCSAREICSRRNMTGWRKKKNPFLFRKERWLSSGTMMNGDVCKKNETSRLSEKATPCHLSVNGSVRGKVASVGQGYVHLLFAWTAIPLTTSDGLCPGSQCSSAKISLETGWVIIPTAHCLLIKRFSALPSNCWRTEAKYLPPFLPDDL